MLPPVSSQYQQSPIKTGSPKQLLFMTFWGLNDRRSWRVGQNPLLFDADNQRKPAYAAIIDALLHPSP